MRVIVAPDKFKGSLTSFEACDSIRRGIKSTNNKIEVSEFPMADGGDGFALVLKHYLQTTTIHCESVDPLGRQIRVSYQWNETEKAAVIEMAIASGLVLLTEDERNPLYASSFGTGLMIRHAIEKGAKKIVLGLGGSATNDGGTGILSALGFQFKSETGNHLQANGENLLQIKEITPPSFIPRITFEIACDVNNVLHGHQGAAYIYAPQKGADKKQVVMLDHGLKNLAGVLQQQTGKDISAIPGTGAAGGIAAGLLPFFDVVIKKGIELIINASKIDDHLPGADLVITGEGQIDSQSISGKVVGHIASLAKKHGLDCFAFCGSVETDAAEIPGIKKIVTLTDEMTSRERAIKDAADLLQKKASQLSEISAQQ